MRSFLAAFRCALVKMENVEQAIQQASRSIHQTISSSSAQAGNVVAAWKSSEWTVGEALI